jgi:hypothetical protein
MTNKSLDVRIIDEIEHAGQTGSCEARDNRGTLVVVLVVFDRGIAFVSLSRVTERIL